MNSREQRDAFRSAIERQDYAALMAVFTPAVVFHSPIVHQPYVGRESLAPLLAAIMQVFTNFRYVGEYLSTDGKVLVFHAKVGERELDGVDILTFDQNDLVKEFTVMVRPYSAATTLRELMAATLAGGH